MIDGIELRGIPIRGADTKRKRGLLPCPLCGNEALLIEYDGGFFTKCTCCECMVARQISVVTERIIPFESEEEAIAKWNTRKSITQDARGANLMESADAILARREMRADLIAEAIERAGGDPISVPEIMSDTGLRESMIRNNMNYVKRKYPQVHSEMGKAGYYWED